MYLFLYFLSTRFHRMIKVTYIRCWHELFIKLIRFWEKCYLFYNNVQLVCLFIHLICLGFINFSIIYYTLKLLLLLLTMFDLFIYLDFYMHNATEIIVTDFFYVNKSIFFIKASCLTFVSFKLCARLFIVKWICYFLLLLFFRNVTFG